MDESLLPLLVIPVFLVIFPLWWSVVVYVIGLTAGWQALGKRYRTALEAPKGSTSMASGRMGWSRYNNVLTIGFAPDGLHLDVFPLFRPGHAPLRIPWSDVNDTGDVRGIFFKFRVLRLGPDRTRFLLPEKLWAAGRSARAAGSEPAQAS